MSEYLYITADKIGTATGGGAVTKNEFDALRALGDTEAWQFPDAPRPWGADEIASQQLLARPEWKPRLAHFYAGAFSKTVDILKRRRTKVVYTIAAHDIDISRAEHEKLGLSFNFPHLNEPLQWAEYSRGYKTADVVVCPSKHSADVVKKYGDVKDVRIIPHGVDLPSVVVPMPMRFSAAWHSQAGADKGFIYALQAWAMLNYRDATLSISGYGTEKLLPYVRKLGAGNIYLRGTVARVSDIYNQCRILIVSSTTEGFNLGVLEAMAHGRPVICSDGAGAADVAKVVVPSRNPQALAEAIDAYRREPWRSAADGEEARETAKKYTWEIVRKQYQDLWRSL